MKRERRETETKRFRFKSQERLTDSSRVDLTDWRMSESPFHGILLLIMFVCCFSWSACKLHVRQWCDVDHRKSEMSFKNVGIPHLVMSNLLTMLSHFMIHPSSLDPISNSGRKIFRGRLMLVMFFLFISWSQYIIHTYQYVKNTEQRIFLVSKIETKVPLNSFTFTFVGMNELYNQL